MTRKNTTNRKYIESEKIKLIKTFREIKQLYL